MATDLQPSDPSIGLDSTPDLASTTWWQLTPGTAAFRVDLETIMKLRKGFIDYDDLTSASTPLAVSAATETPLTNDGAGPFSVNTYKPREVAELWDVATDRLDFSGLVLGDEVIIRVDISPTTLTTNTDVTVGVKLGIGGTPYVLNFLHDKPFKTAAAHPHEIIMIHIYMGDTNTLNNPAEIVITADKAMEVNDIGFYISLN